MWSQQDFKNLRSLKRHFAHSRQVWWEGHSLLAHEQTEHVGVHNRKNKRRLKGWNFRRGRRRGCRRARGCPGRRRGWLRQTSPRWPSGRKTCPYERWTQWSVIIPTDAFKVKTERWRETPSTKPALPFKDISETAAPAGVARVKDWQWQCGGG